MMIAKIKYSLCLILTATVSFGWLTTVVAIPPPQKPIIISFGQPNIWSLEQAHYLLARLRAQTLGLQSKDLAAADLDPNEVNGTRLQTLKTLLGIGVGFNEAAGFQNSQATKELQFSQDRRHQLLALRDQRQVQLHDVNLQLAQLKIDREKMNADSSSTDAAKKVKDTEIEQMTAQQTALKDEITNITTEISNLPASATSLATPTPPSAESSPLPSDVVDSLLATDGFKNEMNQSPKLNASTKIDNYLNLQYELLAKQLTSLRDEVGPHQRLVFLELPQSFYTVPDKSNRKLAQVWWRVEGHYDDQTTDETSPLDNDCNEMYEQEQREAFTGTLPSDFYRRCNQHGTGRPLREKEVFSEAFGEITSDDDVRAIDLIPRQSALNVNDIQDKQKKFNLMGLFTWLSGVGITLDYQREQRLYQQFLQQDVYASAFGKGSREFGWTFGPRPGMERISPGLQTTYAVLVVPDDWAAITLKARGCYFSRTGYAPSRFEEAAPTSNRGDLQCVEREPFKMLIPSTSQNNFWVTGLDYRPVKPGDRATVYIRGDYFSPQIGVLVNGVALRHSIGLAQSELAVPRRENGFDPAPLGDFEFVNSKLLILSFNIPNFKGTPTISLVTPGRARIVNDLRIVINDSYKCSDAEYKLKLKNCVVVNNGKEEQLRHKLPSADRDVPEENSIWVKLDKQPAIFSESSPAPVLSIDALKLFDSGGSFYRAQLTGSKFSEQDNILVNDVPIVCTDGKATVPCGICKDANGKEVSCKDKSKVWPVCEFQRRPVACPNLLAPGLFELQIPKTRIANLTSLDFTIIHTEKKAADPVYVSKSFPNPFMLRVDKVTIVDYKPKAKPNPVMTVSLEGVGFSSSVQIAAGDSADIGVSRSVSPTTMVFSLTLKPTAGNFIVVNLADLNDPDHPIPVVINRPAAPAEPASSKEGDKTKKKKKGARKVAKQ